jgi:hypothetical protein
LLVSLVYWALRRLLELVVLCLRSERSKELEILVLRHQLDVFQRQAARRGYGQPTGWCSPRLAARCLGPEGFQKAGSLSTARS